jgi:hypothetical protein
LIYLENSLFSWLEADETAMGNLIDKTSISLFLKEFYRCKINLLFDTEEKVISLKIKAANNNYLAQKLLDIYSGRGML